MALSTMYPAKANSPQTTLAAGITAADTSMTLSDASVLPAAPNLCTLGADEDAEVVSYSTITGNVVSGLIRGVSGTTASPWPIGTQVAREFTSYDHDTFKANIEYLNGKVLYGVCDTAAATVNKEVTISDFSLKTGVTIVVKFTNTNSATNPTLSVNSGTAYPIYRYGTTASGTKDTAGRINGGAVILLTFDGTGWIQHFWVNTDTIYGAYSTTAAATAAKTANCQYFQLNQGYFEITIRYDNTAQSALTLNIGSTGAIPIYINGSPSSATNYTLPGGVYIVYYDGTNYYFRTDGKIEGLAPANLYFTGQSVSAATNAQIMRIPSSGTDSRITADTVVLECTYADPSKITSNVTWNSYDGYITFIGTCTAGTSANVTLGQKGN